MIEGLRPYPQMRESGVARQQRSQAAQQSQAAPAKR
jgi:hypothetical protein